MAREFYGATAAAEQKINEMLSLPASGREQDWEFELADPSRVGEMLNIASNNNLNYDEKCALALLTFASIEELIELDEENDLIIERAKFVLKQNNDVREAMIFYWIEQGRASDVETARKLLLE